MHSAAVRLAERITVPFRRARAARTEPLSATELPRRYLAAVLGYVAARVAIGMEAEDIAAEVFGAAFVSIHACPRRPAAEGEDDPVRAWLFGIARRKLADAYRRRARHDAAALSPALAAPVGQGPEARMLADEAARTLREILNELPEMQREALLLKYREGLSLVEIGEILRRSPGAIGQLLHRARQAVRDRGGVYFGESAERKEAGR